MKYSSQKEFLAFALLLIGNNSLGCDAFSLKHGGTSTLPLPPPSPSTTTTIISRSKPLYMQKKDEVPMIKSRKSSKINASNLAYFENDFSSSSSSSTIIPKPSFLEDFVLPVTAVSGLVASNTIGAGLLILPDLAEGPGLGVTLLVFAAFYIVNLISGIVIADIAIQQRETSGKDAPSSFKALSEENLDSPLAKHGVAAVSVVKNALVLAFGTMKAGQLGQDIFGLDAEFLSMVWVTGFAALVGSQTAPNLSKVASAFVAILFTSFTAILLPGLTSLGDDPLSIILTPGTAVDPMASLTYAAPIIFMSFIFQNIVPTTARILDYQREKVVSALVFGTLLPLIMMGSWCLAVLGGGIDTSVGLDGPLFTIFSIVTIAGSHLGSSTSMAEELDTYLRPSSSSQEQQQQEVDVDRKNDVFSNLSVGITALMAFGLGELFSNDLNDLLSLAGTYGSPLLYFVLPFAMAWNQQQQQGQNSNNSDDTTIEEEEDFASSFGSSIPLAVASASALTGYIGSEVIQNFGGNIM